jgi:hypothetical protein
LAVCARRKSKLGAAVALIAFLPLPAQAQAQIDRGTAAASYALSRHQGL